MFPFTAVLYEDHEAQNDEDRYRADASLHAEVDIVEQAVRRRGGIQPEYGVGGYDSAVRQSEEDALGEIPRGVDPHGEPDASGIPFQDGESDSAKRDVQDRYERLRLD